ncbi:tetratricopeptide repeat protein 12 [Rhinatrema bivittatum]|uniref:tetratricopeptide repeat protein 12 n=1 Tax=Rhinatrema bivittatum TaxID=194408 RepID=UPI001128DBB3|nr:tetratricopeptide repeat protein 12 [Rhinatrema bivittatum]
MTDCTNKTLFRTGSGFSILNDNKIVRRSISTTGEDGALDLCLSVIMLWQAVCQRNEENQRVLLALSSTGEQLFCLLMSRDPEIHRQSLALLAIYTQTEMGRDMVNEYLDLPELVQALLRFMDFPDERASTAIGLLTDLAQEERFRVQLRSNFSTVVLPSFTRLLRSIELVNAAALPQSIAVLGNLSLDTVMRGQMSACELCWKACLEAVDKCQVHTPGSSSRDLLFAILGLMVNLSLEQNAVIQEYAGPVTHMCMALLNSKDGGILTRTMGILSHVLPQCPIAIEDAVTGGVVKKILQFLKAGGQTTTLYSIKTLAVCTKSSLQAREDVVMQDKRFRILMKLLSSESELIVGNTSLCLGNCLEVPGAASSLLKSDILKVLLRHAGGDAKKTAVQKNAAIALGKLCTSEPRYMVELRQLHGIEILNSCMKYVD